MLSHFIENHRQVFDDNYVWLRIDGFRDDHGKEVMGRLRPRPDGVPWVLILDPEGKQLGTSDKPDGKNYGFPSEPDEIELFIQLLKSTAPHLSDEQAAQLKQDLSKPGGSGLGQLSQ